MMLLLKCRSLLAVGKLVSLLFLRGWEAYEGAVITIAERNVADLRTNFDCSLETVALLKGCPHSWLVSNPQKSCSAFCQLKRKLSLYAQALALDISEFHTASNPQELGLLKSYARFAALGQG
jgi:hypothetical protein